MSDKPVRTMADFKAKYSIPKEVRKRIKPGTAKSFFLCARKCNNNGKTYRVKYQRGEISFSIHDHNGKLESARYFHDNNKAELLKLAKGYHQLNLGWIETPVLKLLAETVK